MLEFSCAKLVIYSQVSNYAHPQALAEGTMYVHSAVLFRPISYLTPDFTEPYMCAAVPQLSLPWRLTIQIKTSVLINVRVALPILRPSLLKSLA